MRVGRTVRALEPNPRSFRVYLGIPQEHFSLLSRRGEAQIHSLSALPDLFERITIRLRTSVAKPRELRARLRLSELSELTDLVRLAHLGHPKHLPHVQHFLDVGYG